MSRQKILMLTHRIPYPPDRGDRIRALNVLREFSKHWDVWLACTNDEPIEGHQLEYLRRFCTDVATDLCVDPFRWMRAARYAVCGRSLTEGLFASELLNAKVKEWEQSIKFDAVYCYCSSMYQYAKSLPITVPMIVDLVDVDSQKWSEHERTARFGKRFVYGMESRRVLELERTAAGRASCVTLVSDDELDSFREFVDNAATCVAVGNGVDVDYFRPSDNSSAEVATLAFVGVLDYGPNVEGIAWFVHNVLPKIQESMPVRLSIVGRRPIAEVNRLAHVDGVSVHSDVSDVRQYLHNADAVVAPLRIARGIQNKVLEAMACGRPVVATSAAAAGIEAVQGKELVVADEVDDFADCIVQLLHDKELRNQIGTAARLCVEEKYTWPARLTPMVQLMSDVISTKQPAGMAS